MLSGEYYKIFKSSCFEDLQMATSDTKRVQHTKGNLTKFRTSSERAMYTQFSFYVVGVVLVSLLLLVIDSRFRYKIKDQDLNTRFRSSPLEVFLGKSILKICSRFTGEHPCRSMISIKLFCNFIEITLQHGCSPANLLDIFRIPFLRNTSRWLLLKINL